MRQGGLVVSLALAYRTFRRSLAQLQLPLWSPTVFSLTQKHSVLLRIGMPVMLTQPGTAVSQALSLQLSASALRMITPFSIAGVTVKASQSRGVLRWLLKWSRTGLGFRGCLQEGMLC